MELIDIQWCLACCIRRAHRYMEITGRQTIGGPSTKLGFDKSKVTCFKCKQKGHFKRECNNSAVDGTENPFNGDYYRKAIYHRSKEETPNLKQIENNFKEKSRACVVIQDDEGFNWSEFLPQDDLADDRFKEKVKKEALNKHHVLVAEIKEKTQEEILKEKTERERFFVGCRIEKMHEEYEEAKYYGRYDKKRYCYINKNVDSVVHRKEVMFDDVLAVIPLSGEYYSNVKDKNYLKKLDKIIRDVMTASLKKKG
ncbi:putative transcription factor interactor and regulator CCHC(Zn) family [Helianthus annuus]|nr:putative transcription factor interactor and regulator CCHC(Zn) family [Helianthus annuus]KAJ0748109.1 putative transcription factor interactor and regulator CCHC(Zn) family [Helianthus annuus]